MAREKKQAGRPAAMDGAAFERCLDRVVRFLENKGVILVVGNQKFYSMTNLLLRPRAGNLDTRLLFLPDEAKAGARMAALARGGARVLACLRHSEADEGVSFKFLQAIKADPALKSAPVVVVSNQMFEEKVAMFVERGADCIVVTPYAQDTMAAKLADAVDPPEDLRLYRMGKEQLNKGDVDRAMSVAETMLSRYPDSPRSHYLQGEGFQARGKRKSAVRCYVAACKLDQARMFLGPRIKLEGLYDELCRKKGLDREQMVKYRTKQLRYIEQLERLSPICLERKIKRCEALLALARKADAETAVQETYDFHRSVRKQRGKLMRLKSLDESLELIAFSALIWPDMALNLAHEIKADPNLRKILDKERSVELGRQIGLALAAMVGVVYEPEVFLELFRESKAELDQALALRPEGRPLALLQAAYGLLFAVTAYRLDKGMPSGNLGMKGPDALAAAKGYVDRACRVDPTAFGRFRRQADLHLFLTGKDLSLPKPGVKAGAAGKPQAKTSYDLRLGK